MTRLKILILLISILFVGVKCTFTEKEQTDKQVEFAEYITGISNPTYEGCETFRDSSIRKAETIASHLSFLDSTFKFNADEYSKKLDNNIYYMSKQANKDTTLLMTVWLLFIIVFFYIVYNIRNALKLSPQSSKVKRRRLLISIYVSSLLFIFNIILFAFVYHKFNTNSLDIDKINNKTIQEYFLEYDVGT